MNSLVFAKNVNGIDLYLAWVNGERSLNYPSDT